MNVKNKKIIIFAILFVLFFLTVFNIVGSYPDNYYLNKIKSNIPQSLKVFIKEKIVVHKTYENLKKNFEEQRKNLDKAFSSKRGIKGESNSISRVIKDESPASRYFNITEIPDYLGVGKNTIRLMGSVELKKNSEIQIEILDARGNPIYFEIPKKTQRDGSRLISIWVYTNRTDYFENTASGNATITIVGTDTNNIPVKWNRIIPVRVNQKTSSEIIFDEKTLPTAQVSASLQPFSTFQLDSSKTDSLSQGRDKKLTLRIDTHSVKYQKSTFGDDVILTKTGGTGFNSMMIGGEVRLDLSSQTVFPRETAGTQPTNFTSSILSVSSSNILQIKDAITGSNNHIYRFTDGATIPTFIEYFSIPNVFSTFSNNLLVKATSSGPCILGFTI